MKRIRLKFIVLLLTFCVLIFSCKKEEVQSSGSATTAQNNALSTKMIMTPYGKLPASRVHEIDSKTIAKIIDGRLQLLNLKTGKLVKDLGILSKEDIENAVNPVAFARHNNNSFAYNALNSNSTVASGGINYQGYGPYNDDVNNIQSFSTTWIVPEKPLYISNDYDNTTFLWNGLAGGNIQPVLEWYGGPDYTIANWYWIDGNAFYGQRVTVQVGAKLEAVITLVSNDNNNWVYKESFIGYPEADVTLARSTEAFGVMEAWEAYTPLLSQWPNQPKVIMRDIKLTTRTGTPPKQIDWLPYGGPLNTPSGKNTVIVNSSASKGRIDFYFGDGTGISPDSSYNIVSATNGNKVLDVARGLSVNGAPVILYNSNNKNSQKWKLISLHNGYYKLLSGNAPAKALTVKNKGAGKLAGIYTDNGMIEQQWKINPVGNGYCTMSPASAPSLSLSVISDGIVLLRKPNSTNAAEFKFVPVE